MNCAETVKSHFGWDGKGQVGDEGATEPGEAPRACLAGREKGGLWVS